MFSALTFITEPYRFILLLPDVTHSGLQRKTSVLGRSNCSVIRSVQVLKHTYCISRINIIRIELQSGAKLAFAISQVSRAAVHQAQVPVEVRSVPALSTERDGFFHLR